MEYAAAWQRRLLLFLACGGGAVGCGGQADAVEKADRVGKADAVGKADTTSDSRAGAMVTASTMAGSRAAHSATTLPDGRVLVAGGFTTREYEAAGTEIYDPSRGTFGPGAPMRTPRYGHTATLLPGGKVLLAGGWAGRGEYLASAELFDPATGTFAPAGAMNAARAGHVALALRDGRVLLAGGVGTGRTFLSSAELYDPATGRFSPTGAMSVPRENHAAVRLADGRVLVAGGHTGRQADLRLHGSAEIYDPAAGTFSPTGAMGVRRHKHDAVLLRDGKVLVTGGSDERDGDGAYASAELYDAETGTFRPAGSMRLRRYKHFGTSVVLADGRVLVAGGAERAEVYDPEAGSFAIVPGEARMAGLYSAVAPLPDGSVLATGGYGEGRGPQTGAWLYRP